MKPNIRKHYLLAMKVLALAAIGIFLVVVTGCGGEVDESEPVGAVGQEASVVDSGETPPAQAQQTPTVEAQGIAAVEALRTPATEPQDTPAADAQETPLPEPQESPSPVSAATPRTEPQATPTLEPEGNLESLLHLIPATPEISGWVVLNDYVLARDSHGIPLPGDPGSDEDLLDYIRLLYENAQYATGPWLSGYTDWAYLELEYREYRGFDFRDVDQSIQAVVHLGNPLEALRGSFSPSGTESALASCGQCPDFEREEHLGIEFYAWGEDYARDLEKRNQPPFFDLLGRFGRVAVLDSHLLRTLGTEAMRSLISAQLGEENTLADDPDLALAARTLDGLGVYSAVIMRNVEVFDGESAGFGCDDYCNPDEYAEAQVRFNDTPLDRYMVLGTGVGADEDGLFTGIVLIYGDEGAAERNVQVLKERLATWDSKKQLPWSEIYSESEVWHEGRTLVSKLRSESNWPWLTTLQIIDSLLLYR